MVVSAISALPVAVFILVLEIVLVVSIFIFLQILEANVLIINTFLNNQGLVASP
jgi:hypothetical protein